MKAGLWKGINVIEYEEVPEPQPGPDEVKLKTAYTGICGSDPEIIEGRFAPMKPPTVIGHESSGIIVEVGSSITEFKVGQKVAIYFQDYCGSCYYCRNRMEHFCENRGHATGGFAEYIVSHKSMVCPIPDGVSLEEAALAEPVSVAVHATDLANIYPGCSVAISGAGPIGLLVLEIAVKSGAVKTLVSEPVAGKRQLAKKLGADVVVDPINEDLEEIGKQLTDGRGFNCVIEASGNLAAAKQSIFMAAGCGTVLWVGIYPQGSEVSIPPPHMFNQELTLRSTKLSPYTFHRAMALLPKLDLKPIISDILPLKDISKAFEVHKSGKSVKILIKP
jgi:L-iditol 2-dehydrogenase